MANARLVGLLVAFVISLSASTAWAQNYELKWDPVIDGIVTGTAVFSWLSMETFLKEPLSPKNCRWCTPLGFDDDLRTSLRFQNQAVPKTISDVNLGASAILAFGGLATLGALDGQGTDFFLNALLLTETVAVTMLFTNLVKITVARKRPPTAETAFDEGSHEGNLSFFSGHTSFTTVFGAAAGTIALLRNYKHAKVFFGLGLGMGLFTAVMRIGADAHYFTDVLTGFLVGAGFGIGIPLLFHGRKPKTQQSALSRTTVSPLPNGLNFSFVF